MPKGEIIFEIIQLGAYLKVSAIDPITMVEVSVMGPANGALEAIKATAARKLQRALETGRGVR